MQEFNIDDFQWLEYFPAQTSSKPEVTVNADSIIFNRATLKKLGSPSSIKLMFDEKGKRIAIQGFSKKCKNTIDFIPGRKSRDFGIFRHDRVEFIRGLMPVWNEGTRFKVHGDYYERENVMVFDLKIADVFKGGKYPGNRQRNKATMSE